MGGRGVFNIQWGFDMKLASIPTTKAGSTFFSTKMEGWGDGRREKKGTSSIFFGGEGGGDWALGMFFLGLA